MEVLKSYRVCIAISTSFFIFGFFVAADLFELSSQDMAAGLIAGAVAGITILLVTIDGTISLRPEIRRRLGWDRPPSP
jgi:hypothetical protein